MSDVIKVADENDILSSESSFSEGTIVIKGYDSRGICVTISSEPIWDEIDEINKLIGSRIRAAYKNAKCYIKFEWQEISSEQEDAIREYASYWGYIVLERNFSLIMHW